VLIQAFGTVAVSTMAIAYALEGRSRSFVLIFAVACLASSVYAGLIRAWPFAVIEFFWAGIAIRRWMGRDAGGVA